MFSSSGQVCFVSHNHYLRCLFFVWRSLSGSRSISTSRLLSISRSLSMSKSTSTLFNLSRSLLMSRSQSVSTSCQGQGDLLCQILSISMSRSLSRLRSLSMSSLFHMKIVFPCPGRSRGQDKPVSLNDSHHHDYKLQQYHHLLTTASLFLNTCISTAAKALYSFQLWRHHHRSNHLRRHDLRHWRMRHRWKAGSPGASQVISGN